MSFDPQYPSRISRAVSTPPRGMNRPAPAPLALPPAPLPPDRQLNTVVSSTRGRRDRIIRRALVVVDLIAIELALLAAGVASPTRADPGQLALLNLPLLAVWVLLFKLYGLYDRDVKRISHGGIDDLPWLFHSLIIGMLGFWAFLKLVPVQQMLFVEVAVFGLVALPLMIILRSATRHAVLRALGPEQVLIAGSSPTCELLVRKLGGHPEYGLTPAAILSPYGGDRRISISGDGINHSRVGGARELEQMLASGCCERVIVSRADFGADDVVEMIDHCRRYSVKIGVIPGTSDAFGPSLELDEVEGMTVLGVNPPVLGRTSHAVKRGFDLLITVPALLVLSPIMALIALAIALDSPGSVLFRQRRIGKGGRRFEVLKFRTMDADAESHRDVLMEKSLDPNWLHLEHDPRVTRFGGFLRRSSLDELPQLINVLRGQMSLVGPRPLPEEEDAMVGGRARGRLDLTPGVTGLWQVLGRTSIPFEEMVKLDYIYVANWTIWMDLRLLLRTLPAILRQRGVN